jgi:hypothetical protein
MKIGYRLLVLLALTFSLTGGQTPNAVSRITDLFTADERSKAGISKLNNGEMAALNGAIFRVFIEMNSDRLTSRGQNAISTSAQNLEFYDSRGRAVAYIDGEENLTIYLWEGKPVGYLEDDSIFGFNGKHLGWLKGNAIYDHDGNVVAALPEAFSSTVSAPPAKGFKQFLPFKSFKEFKPFKPFFNSSWSDIPAKVFFLKGASN